MRARMPSCPCQHHWPHPTRPRNTWRAGWSASPFTVRRQASVCSASRCVGIAISSPWWAPPQPSLQGNTSRVTGGGSPTAPHGLQFKAIQLRSRAPHHGDEIAMPTHLDAEHTEACLLTVKGDTSCPLPARCSSGVSGVASGVDRDMTASSGTRQSHRRAGGLGVASARPFGKSVDDHGRVCEWLGLLNLLYVPMQFF